MPLTVRALRRTLFVAGVTALALAGATARARADDKGECAATAEHAQELKAGGRLVTARQLLLTCSAPRCPPLVRNDCIAWLGEVDANLASLVVRARDSSGNDVMDVRVLLDGNVVRERLDGTAFVVDPGPHVLRIEAAGVAPIVQNLLVQQGEKNRLVTADIVSPTATQRPLPSQPPSAQTTPLADASLASADTRAPVTAYVTGGIAVAALGTFGVLEIIAQGEYGRLQGGCAKTHSCASDDVSGTRTKLVAAGVALGVGVVATGLTVVLLLLPRTARRAPVTARVVTSPGGAGLRLTW